MNPRALTRLWHRYVWLVAVFAQIACLTAARADRVIETPAGTILGPLSASVENVLGLDRRAQDDLWVNGSYQLVELEGAQLERHGQHAQSLSIQFAVLPETFITPSVSVGVRDVFDTTRQFGDLGYYGRSFYFAAGKTLVNTQLAPFPFRNAAVTAGLGTGVTNGLFGSASADLALGLRQTLEFDGRSLNYRISREIGGIGRIEYERLHGANFVGIELSTPVRM